MGKGWISEGHDLRDGELEDSLYMCLYVCVYIYIFIYIYKITTRKIYRLQSA